MNESFANESFSASGNNPQSTSARAPLSTLIVFGVQLPAMAIGIAVVCILFCLTFAVGTVLFYRRKKQRQRTACGVGTYDGNQGRRPSFKERMKDRLRPWKRSGEVPEPPPIDDLVFSTIQQLPPTPHPLFLHPYSRYTTMESSNSVHDPCSCARTSTAAPRTTEDRLILQSLARQREFDRAGYFVKPQVSSSVSDQLEEAMLQHHSRSTYHVW
ncbi:hypothetical protein BX666DRAFT_2024351 [Dichotomocladium elegans]|nr:hypothetical protein BX666DRAFT_2024351 [Dichotomocladium elegans]